jgi:hypothetical protein
MGLDANNWQSRTQICHSDKFYCENNLFYIVGGLVNDSDFEFGSILRWIFGINMYSNTKSSSRYRSCFQFSKSYSYSIFAPLIDGCPDMNLRYFIFFHIFRDLVTYDLSSSGDSEVQIEADFEFFQGEVRTVSDFLYFVGFGVDKLILYDDFEYFVQFMIRNSVGLGSNAWVIVSFVKRLCIVPVSILGLGR